MAVTLGIYIRAPLSKLEGYLQFAQKISNSIETKAKGGDREAQADRGDGATSISSMQTTKYQVTTVDV